MKAYHKLHTYSYSGVLNIGSRLVTLIAHAQKGYGICFVCLCLSVCLSITTLMVAAFIFIIKLRYKTVILNFESGEIATCIPT